MTIPDHPTRLDEVEVGDHVRTLGPGWCRVDRAYTLTLSVYPPATVLHLIAEDGTRYEMRDRPNGTIDRQGDPRA